MWRNHVSTLLPHFTSSRRPSTVDCSYRRSATFLISQAHSKILQQCSGPAMIYNSRGVQIPTDKIKSTIISHVRFIVQYLHSYAKQTAHMLISSGGSWWKWPGGQRNFISGWTYRIVALAVFIISGVSSHSSSPNLIKLVIFSCPYWYIENIHFS